MRSGRTQRDAPWLLAVSAALLCRHCVWVEGRTGYVLRGSSDVGNICVDSAEAVIARSSSILKVVYEQYSCSLTCYRADKDHGVYSIRMRLFATM